jgi:hypothetical protein
MRTLDLLRRILCEGRDVVIVQKVVSPDDVDMLVDHKPAIFGRNTDRRLLAGGRFVD